jgi:hypothetical protein
VRNQPTQLFELEQTATAIEQGALATRVAWLRVDALRRTGETEEAARRARELLAQPLWPSDLLPCHWLWIAHVALAAVGDPLAGQTLDRARAAYAETLADLGKLSGPAATFPMPDPK